MCACLLRSISPPLPPSIPSAPSSWIPLLYFSQACASVLWLHPIQTPLQSILLSRTEAAQSYLMMCCICLLQSRQSEPHCGVLCLYQAHTVEFAGVSWLDHTSLHCAVLYFAVSFPAAASPCGSRLVNSETISCLDVSWYVLCYTVTVSPLRLPLCHSESSCQVQQGAVPLDQAESEFTEIS